MAFNVFSLADTYGAGERAKQDAQEFQSRNALADLQQQYLGQQMQTAQAAEQRAQAKFGQEQQDAELKRREDLLMLSHAGLSDVAQNPAAAGRWESLFKQAGLLRQDFDWRAVPPQELQAYAQRELQGVQAAVAAINQSRFKNQLAPSAVQTYEYYRSLSPDQQAQMLETMRAPTVREVGGVQSIVQASGGVRPLSTVDQEAAARARIAGAEAGAKTTATAVAEARADLPRAEGNAEDTLRLLGQLKRAPLQYIYGAASMAPVVPGTPQADAFALWEQVQGQAFLKAFESLKGGGQITEVEGQKATAAITRLSQRKMSPQAAQQAITELESIVRAGLARARRKAGSAQDNRSLDDLLNQYGR